MNNKQKYISISVILILSFLLILFVHILTPLTTNQLIIPSIGLISASLSWCIYILWLNEKRDFLRSTQIVTPTTISLISIFVFTFFLGLILPVKDEVIYIEEYNIIKTDYSTIIDTPDESFRSTNILLYKIDVKKIKPILVTTYSSYFLQINRKIDYEIIKKEKEN